MIQVVTRTFRPLLIVKDHVQHTLPVVEQELARVRHMAEQMHDRELKSQALSSIDKKRFHCDGGSVFATWLLQDGLDRSSEAYASVLRFIVAFQTISDYLDNLCDRTGSVDEQDFRQMHQAMFDALKTADSYPKPDYYLYHPHKDDNGYLAGLVTLCNQALSKLVGYPDVERPLSTLVSLYVDLQVNKHSALDRREQKLIDGFKQHQSAHQQLFWWEFAAATGSTLAMFALIAEAAREHPLCDREALLQTYFPSVCGLHILLDYLIDKDEDKREGDLNFVSYYKDQAEEEARIGRMLNDALSRAKQLSDPDFHLSVVYGLLGLYLSDPKVKALGQEGFANRLVKTAGWRAQIIRAVSARWRRRTYV